MSFLDKHDAGVVTSLTGQVNRLRRRAVIDRFVLVGPESRRPAVPEQLPYVPIGGASWEMIVPAYADVVLVHDPSDFLDADLVTTLLATVWAGTPLVVPVDAVTDTIKLRTAEGLLESTVDRSELRSVRTPWACAAAQLRGAVRIGTGGVATIPWALDGPLRSLEVGS